MKKTGKLNSGMITGAMIVVLVITIIFSAYSAIVPSAQTAGDTMTDKGRCEAVGCFYNITSGSANATNSILCEVSADSEDLCTQEVSALTTIPLGGLFGGTGVVFVIIMAALIVLIISALLKGKKD